MGWSKEELGEIISKHPLRAAAAMSFIVAGATSLVVSNSGITASNVTANGTVSIEPAGEATGFDASPLGILDGAVLPTPVVTAGALNVLESAWDIDDKVANTIGWRLRTEGAAGDSSNAPTTKLLIQSTADNSTWTTRATIDMAGLLAVTGAITGTTGTFSGDLAVNGEDITCDSAGGATVFNSNATSGAMFGAATGNLDICGGSGSTGATLECNTGDLALSGDIEAAGGYRTRTPVIAAANVPPAGETGDWSYWPTSRTGSVTAITCAKTGTITAGTVHCEVRCNSGCAGTQPYVESTVGSPQNVTLFAAKDTYTFTQHAYLGVWCEGSADLEPATVDFACWVEYEQ